MSSIQPDPMKPLSTSDDRPHAPPTDEEAIYYTGSPLLGGKPEKVLGLILAGLIFISLPLVYRLVSNHLSPPSWAWMVCAAIAFVFWIASFVIVKSTHYRISNYRIDYERGLISKDISTLELWHVEDIAFHQSILDRILGIGTIRVISHDDNMPDLHMRGLPDARKLFEELKQRIISVKRQSGVLKLDSGT